jgi:tryptophan synthase beta chain
VAISAVWRAHVAETLMPLILDLDAEYRKARPTRHSRPNSTICSNICRSPEPALFRAPADRRAGRRPVWFKRDELNHTGAHKINNCIGRSCWPSHGQDADHRRNRRGPARRGHRHRLRASACLASSMGATDVERQQPNVFRMKLLGAEVVPVRPAPRRSRTR